jgi:predicted transcriptional regulator
LFRVNAQFLNGSMLPNLLNLHFWNVLTLVGPALTLTPMEVRLTETQQSKLNELAAKTGRAPDELIREAVDRLVDYDRWFADQVQVGLDQIGRGEFIEEDEMDARVDRMLQP